MWMPPPTPKEQELGGRGKREKQRAKAASWPSWQGEGKIAKDHMAAAKADLVNAIQETEKPKRLTKLARRTQKLFARRRWSRRKW